MSPLSARLRLVGFGCVALVACATNSTSTSAGTVPTEVSLSPSAFLEGTTCSPAAGGMQSYVVTLRAFDDPSDTVGFPLPSSMPTPCSLTFAMQTVVVAGKLYSAEVDGYELPATALAPYGGASSGSRTMVDAGGHVVAPRWTTTCGGSAAQATLAQANITSAIPACDALVDHAALPASVRVSPEAILGTPACDVAYKLILRMLEGELPLPTSLTCKDQALALTGVPGAGYRFYARGKRIEQTDIGTECSGVFVLGQTLTPACDPPSAFGHVTVRPPASTCPAGATYDVRVGDQPVGNTRMPCAVAAELGPFLSGIVDLHIATFDANGAPLDGQATCKADVEPGRVVDALCL